MGNSIRQQTIASCALALGACLAETTLAIAQDLPSEPVPIAIPAQSLADAIVAFNRQTGLRIVAQGDLVRDLTSTPVNGALPPGRALDMMLSRTGLQYSVTPTNDLVLSAIPSVSDENDADGAIFLDQIIVEGELLTRTLQDTQTSVAVISGEELEQRADPDIFSVIERTAGASLGSAGETIVIRGISQNGVTGAGSDPVITTRIDGAVVNFGRFSNNALESTWDLEQIEVLRGPQSTQSGRNTLGGAIEIRSKDPTYDLEFKGRGQVGNGETLGGAFTANVPLIEERLALRVAVDHDQTEGFVKNRTLGTDDFDRADQTTIRAGLRFDPIDSLSVVFKFTHMTGESSANGPTLVGSEFPENRIALANVEEFEDVTYFNAANLRLDYEINSYFRIQSETTYSESNTYTVLDIDNTPADLGTFVNDQTVELFEQEVKVIYESDRMNAVFGGFFATDDTNFPQDAVFPASFFNPSLPSTVTVSTTAAPARESTNFAVFGEAEINLWPDLTLIAGGRYDYQTTETSTIASTAVSDPAFEFLLPPAASGSAEQSFGAFLPKVGLIYDITDDASLGFTVQRGYRSGGVDINRVNPQQFSEFDPEYTWNYEVALRSQWLDNRLTVNANAFYTDWTDMQIRPFDEFSGLPGLTENAASSRLFGGELSMTYQPNSDLDLFASFGYTNTKFSDFEENTGNEFPFSSKYTASFGATYYVLQDAFISADASYQSGAFSDVENTDSQRVDGRFLVNARIGYEAENWGVIAYISNVFDNDYVTNVQNAVLGQQGNIVAGPPRTFGVIGQIRF